MFSPGGEELPDTSPLLINNDQVRFLYSLLSLIQKKNPENLRKFKSMENKFAENKSLLYVLPFSCRQAGKLVLMKVAGT